MCGVEPEHATCQALARTGGLFGQAVGGFFMQAGEAHHDDGHDRDGNGGESDCCADHDPYVRH
ncbi:MAG TPA: hypothetical protein VFQ44_29940 [Streptosporangiaceae bacterium]|nr:hypothetical protein [Streptosporangiaceae bacterium]